MIGKTLGHYEILEPLGKGGMGEVYRARDTKLERDVAIKVLPENFAADQDRLARFEREAKLLASLNHANIAAIYGLEDVGDERFIAMELVEGETLAERITSSGRIEVDDALEIARQIADALEAAHESGIVHRDLKPANVKITAYRKVKVLDFGLAKAYEADGSPAAVSPDISHSPTMAAATRAGVILGTAAYMSPEQARGKPLDKRTDIWAFGCVLYEMLGGRRPFDGETVTDILAAVVKEEPDWHALPASTPSRLVRVIRRCLEKDTGRRMRDMGDVALDLEDASALSDGVIGDPPTAATSGLRWSLVATLALAAAAVAFVAGTWRAAPPPDDWVGEKLGGPPVAFQPVASPDGTRIAFLAMDRDLTQLAVMQADSHWRPLTRDRARGHIAHPAWSPDSRRVYFVRGTISPSIYSIAEAGTEGERLELENAQDPNPLPDGSLLAVRKVDRRPQLMRYWPATGKEEMLPVLLVDALVEQAIAVLPPGGEAVVVGRPLDAPEHENHLRVVDLDTGSMRRIAPDVTLPAPQWRLPIAVTPDGLRVYFDLPAGNLHRIVAVRTDGAPGVETVQDLTARPLSMDVASDGTVYVDQIDQPTEIVRSDPEGGNIERFPVLGATGLAALPGDRFLLTTQVAGRSQLMELSPGGAPVPFLVSDEEAWPPLSLVGDDAVAFVGGAPDRPRLTLVSHDGRLLQRIDISSDASVTGLTATPDGATLFYATGGSVFRVGTDGTGSAQVGSGEQVAFDAASGDLVIMRSESTGGVLVRVDSGGGPEKPIVVAGDWWATITNSSSQLTGGAAAPDGRLVVQLESADSWFWPMGIVDTTGRLMPPFFESPQDAMWASWDDAGRVVAIARAFNAQLWRFRRESRR